MIKMFVNHINVFNYTNNEDKGFMIELRCLRVDKAKEGIGEPEVIIFAAEGTIRQLNHILSEKLGTIILPNKKN